MRSAPAAEAWALPGADLLADYDAFVGQLRCGSQGKYLRRMAARRFLTRWPDPAVWMTRPTAARLVDIKRTGAWPFLTWAFVSGALVADLDLLGARANGGHFTAWASRHGDDTARALAVATELGWGPAWAHQVCVNALALVCMTTQRTLDDLDVLDRFVGELAAAPSITANHRRVLAGRLGGLRQVCFQLGLVQEPPPHPNSRPRSWGEHVSAIPQPEIRRVAQRYLEVVATTLRPATVEDRSDNLESFALWLDEHHPDIGRLSQLDRPVIEEFLMWNRTRPSRGRRGRGRPVSTVRAHQGVATLKTFFEDLALWGWAERPPRMIVHRSDLPRLPEAVPRALPPDVDRDLMAAVDRLDDVAGRCAIRILRGTGMRLGELLELEQDCLLDFAGRGSWVRVPLGKLASERTVPVDDETLGAFDDWAAHRSRQRALPHPRTGQPSDFLFVIGGRRMGPSRVRRGLDQAACAALPGGGDTAHQYSINHKAFVDAGTQGFFYAPQATSAGRRYGVRERLLAAKAAFPTRLTIQANALAERVVLEPGHDGCRRAVAVEYLLGDHLYAASPRYGATSEDDRRRRRRTAPARREVIISAGAFNSPQLLMLSGIDHGAPGRAGGACSGRPARRGRQPPGPLRGAGRLRLLSVPAVSGCTFGKPAIDRCLTAWEAANLLGVAGLTPYGTNEILGGIKHRYSSGTRPEMFVFGAPADFRGYTPGFGPPGPRSDRFTWLVLKGNADSRAGTVRPRNPDPTQPPVINFRSFEDGSGGDRDIAAVVEAVEMIRRINASRLGHGGLARSRRQDPGPGGGLGAPGSVGAPRLVHEPGRAGLGSDGGAERKFRVRATSNPRVVDASSFRRIPELFIWAPVATLSEKASVDTISGG